VDAKTKRVLIWVFVGLSLLVGLPLLLCLGLGVWGYLWVDENKDELRADVERTTQEARTFGATTDQNGCVTDGLRRAAGCGTIDVMCEVNAKMFVVECLGAASAVEGFCNGVPAATDILGTTTWSLGQCATLGHPQDQRCTRVIAAVQEHCAGPSASTTSGSADFDWD
jgi:hypothetical protein